MRTLLIALSAVLLSVGIVAAQDATEPKAVAFDLEKLYGDWVYVAGTKAGEAVPQDRLIGTVTISKESFKIPGGPEGDFVMSYSIDAATSPATIDLKIESGPAPEGQAKGIIKLEGDKLWICYEPFGGARPEKMESTEANNAFYFELKRKAT